MWHRSFAITVSLGLTQRAEQHTFGWQESRAVPEDVVDAVKEVKEDSHSE